MVCVAAPSGPCNKLAPREEPEYLTRLRPQRIALLWSALCGNFGKEGISTLPPLALRLVTCPTASHPLQRCAQHCGQAPAGLPSCS